jgi:hypothetical protein
MPQVHLIINPIQASENLVVLLFVIIIIIIIIIIIVVQVVDVCGSCNLHHGLSSDPNSHPKMII